MAKNMVRWRATIPRRTLIDPPRAMRQERALTLSGYLVRWYRRVSRLGPRRGGCVVLPGTGGPTS